MSEQAKTNRLELPKKYDFLYINDEGDGQFSTIQDVCTDNIDYSDDDFPELDPETEVPTNAQLVPLYAREQGLQFEIVNEVGPGGGWPEVKFIGTLNAILRLMEYHHSEPSFSADYYAWVSAGKPKDS